MPAKHHLAIRSWYATHGRHDLPWRKTNDPYAIYVSEVMLQQTQVKTVLERFYYPFLELLPTLTTLAKAPQDDVLKAWQGLGYYNRALNLQKAAKLTAPALPKDIEALQALPGIGRNTAHAIAAFAYHMPVPVMEANVRRILHRVFALETASERELWEKAFELLDEEQPFNYNQAMMDIGAMVCTKTNPDCDNCPLTSICEGKDSPESYPIPKKKTKTPTRKRIIVILQDTNGRYFLSARKSRFLNGLYGFPEYPDTTTSIEWNNQEYPLTAAKNLGIVTQTYSHFTLNATVLLLQTSETFLRGESYPIEALDSLPLSGADTKVIALLKTRLAEPENIP